ncbi:MAG: hypothetical protein M3343_08830 [Actinomycetota bacterium]|nr:hypothetical protein [Actinomycetota bacterium]
MEQFCKLLTVDHETLSRGEAKLRLVRGDPDDNQAYENMGLASTQTLGPSSRSSSATPRSGRVHQQRRRAGVPAMVADRDAAFGDHSQAGRTHSTPST